jgi:hypothetical protein
VLVFLFTGTLIRVWRGSRYRTILRIGGLFLGANFAYAVNAIAFEIFFSDAALNKDRNAFIWSVLSGISVTVGDLCTSVGYWLLAVYYLGISINLPRIAAHAGEGQIHL